MDRNKTLENMTLEDGSLRSEGVQHATEEERRTSTSSFIANEVVGPKPKGCSAVDTCPVVKERSDAAKKNTA